MRAGNASVVVHMHRQPLDPPGTSRVGFVVSKQVGNAVVRNRVKRRLRHLVRELPTPAPVDAVVRALPSAAADPGTLAADLSSAWARAARKVG